MRSADRLSWASVRCHVLGLENLPAAGGALLAANHESFFDAMLVSGLCPRPIRWLSGWEAVAPRWKPLLKALDVIPVEGGRAGVKAARLAVDVMAAGGLAGIFPEGEIRQGDGAVVAGGTVEAGLFRMAKLAGVAVVPVAVLGTGVFGHWRAWLPFSGKTCVIVFGAPLDPAMPGLADAYARAMRDLHQRAKLAACTGGRRPEDCRA